MTRALALLVLAACSAAPPRPDPPVVVGCSLTHPPPARPALAVAACEGYEACLTLRNAADLRRWELSAVTWMNDAWILCGEPQGAPPNRARVVPAP